MSCSSRNVYANTYCVHNVHNSTVVGRGGRIILHILSNSHNQKGVQVIIGLKLESKNMSSATMLKHNIVYKRCLVKSTKSCLKRLKLSALFMLIFRYKEKIIWIVTWFWFILWFSLHDAFQEIRSIKVWSMFFFSSAA